MERNRASDKNRGTSQRNRSSGSGNAPRQGASQGMEGPRLNGDICIKHLRILGFFQELFNSIRDQARLSIDRVSRLAPRSDMAMTLANKSETRALKEFFVCAIHRYQSFLQLCLQVSPPPLPPWDVAIAMYAHLLTPFSFLTDIACNPDFAKLWDRGFGFPIDELAQLIERGLWSDPQSEHCWQQAFPGSPYQLWTDHPSQGGIVALQADGSWLCHACGAEVPFELVLFHAYVLDGSRTRCPRCNAHVDARSSSQQALRRHLEGFMQGHDASRSMLLFLNPKTGSLDSNTLSEELNRIDFFNSPLWTELNRRTSLRWSVVHQAAQSTADRIRRASPASSQPLDGKHHVIERICKRYERAGTPGISVDLLSITMLVERSLSTVLGDRTRSLSKSQWDTQCRGYRDYILAMNTSTSGTVDAPPPPAEIFEFCWWTHLLTPHQYKAWCLKNLGELAPYNIKAFAPNQRNSTGLRLVLNTSGSSSTLPDIQGLNLANTIDNFTLAECEEVLRICGELDAYFGLTTSLAAKELEFRIPETRRPCAMSVLKEHLETDNEANGFRDILLRIFSHLHKTPSVSDCIERAMVHTLAPDSLLNLAFIVPKPHYEYIEAILLAEVIEQEYLSAHGEDRCWNIVYETLTHKIGRSEALFSPHSIQVWVQELKTNYPLTCAAHISKSQDQLHEYYAIAQSLLESVNAEGLGRQQARQPPIPQPPQQQDPQTERQTAQPAPIQQSIEQSTPQPTIEDSHPECVLCCERRPKSLYPERPVTSSCDHDRDVCVPCIAKWIANQLDTKAWNQLICPSCPNLLTSGDVEKFASAATVERYHRFMVKDSQKDDPLFRSCQRTDCSGGQIHLAGASDPLMICAFCGYKMCFVHDRPWHEGQTCEEYDRTRRGDRASERLIQQTTKPCPGVNCGAPIQKTVGCDHMTCARCRYEFCWECLARYSGPEGIHALGASAHRNDCPYRSLPDMAILNPPWNPAAQEPPPNPPRPEWPQGRPYAGNPWWPQNPGYPNYPWYPMYPPHQRPPY